MKCFLIVLVVLLGCDEEQSAPFVSSSSSDDSSIVNNRINNQTISNYCAEVGVQKDCKVVYKTAGGYVSCWDLKQVCRANHIWSDCGAD